MKRKWIIGELKGSKQLIKTANIILSNRIESLLNYINIYFENLSVESLHEVRIALRRVRYSMELFIVCYDKKIFFRLYNKIQLLQEVSGKVRDFDVTIENINYFIDDNRTKINHEIITKAIEKKILVEENFRLELKKFILSKALKDFLEKLL